MYDALEKHQIDCFTSVVKKLYRFERGIRSDKVTHKKKIVVSNNLETMAYTNGKILFVANPQILTAKTTKKYSKETGKLLTEEDPERWPYKGVNCFFEKGNEKIAENVIPLETMFYEHILPKGITACRQFYIIFERQNYSISEWDNSWISPQYAYRNCRDFSNAGDGRKSPLILDAAYVSIFKPGIIFFVPGRYFIFTDLFGCKCSQLPCSSYVYIMPEKKNGESNAKVTHS